VTAPKVLVVERSDNRKTGDIFQSYSDRSTCPDACPLKPRPEVPGGPAVQRGCYAEAGRTALAWNRATAPWEYLLGKVRRLAPGTLWRHNVGGDLPGRGNRIDTCQRTRCPRRTRRRTRSAGPWSCWSRSARLTSY